MLYEYFEGFNDKGETEFVHELVLFGGKHTRHSKVDFFDFAGRIVEGSHMFQAYIYLGF